MHSREFRHRLLKRQEAGKTERMKEPYEKGVAHHLDPEPWVLVREDGCQASVGARAGRAIEPRKRELRGADALAVRGRQHRGRCSAQGAREPRAVWELEHARNRPPGTWEISRLTEAEGAAVRKGTSKDTSPR